AQPLLGRLRQEQDRGRGRADAALARAAAAGHDRASDARIRPAQHAEQRDVLLRPARPQPADPRSGRGRLASPVLSRRRPGRCHGGDARRAGVVRSSVQRDRRGGRDAGRLRRADRRSPQAAGHLRPRRDGAWRQAGRLRPESGLRLPRGVHDDEDSRRARHPRPLLAGGRARANLRMVRARGARSSRRRLLGGGRAPAVTRPTVLVYHADPRYVELMRVPKRGALIRTAATPREAAEPVSEAEILYAWKFPPQLYAKAGRLKWLQVMGAGVDWALVPELPAGVLGMRGRGVTRRGRPVREAARVYPVSALTRALGEADFVVVLLPLTEETRGIIGGAALAAMKPTAWLINIARGAVVDEAALL